MVANHIMPREVIKCPITYISMREIENRIDSLLSTGEEGFRVYWVWDVVNSFGSKFWHPKNFS